MKDCFVVWVQIETIYDGELANVVYLADLAIGIEGANRPNAAYCASR